LLLLLQLVHTIFDRTDIESCLDITLILIYTVF
jgi:hypothetical protein